MVERKEQTLAFVMSLPVSPLDFTVSKLAGNVLTFAVPFVVLLGGTLAVVLFTPLPDGLFVYALLIFAYLLFAYAVSLAVAMSVESERSEEHTSELQSLMRISYAVFCLKKKK